MSDPDMNLTDRVLSDAAQQNPEVRDDLMARVLADAAVAVPRPAAPPRRTLLTRMLDVLGGWPAVGGLATAGVAGLWLGIAPPTGLESFAAQMLGTTEALEMYSTDLGLEFDEVFDG